MKKIALILIYVVLPQLVAYSQSLYLQVGQYHGVSSFMPSYGHFKIRNAYQYGVSIGINITESIDANIGLAYQQNGAKANLYEINSLDGAVIYFHQNYDASFLKIPLDINFKFKNKNTILIGLGAYYNFNLTASIGTDSPNGTISSPIFLEELAQNDYGIRFNPSILIPLNENFILQLGVLQEFGLKAIWIDVVNYSTSANISLRYLL